jgi:hypothetical protein
MNKSRERGLYSFRYKVLNPDHNINDSVELHIKEASIERLCRVRTFYLSTLQEYEDGYNFCLSGFDDAQ